MVNFLTQTDQKLFDSAIKKYEKALQNNTPSIVSINGQIKVTLKDETNEFVSRMPGYIEAH